VADGDPRHLNEQLYRRLAALEAENSRLRTRNIQLEVLTQQQHHHHHHHQQPQQGPSSTGSGSFAQGGAPRRINSPTASEWGEDGGAGAQGGLEGQQALL